MQPDWVGLSSLAVVLRAGRDRGMFCVSRHLNKFGVGLLLLLHPPPSP